MERINNLEQEKTSNIEAIAGVKLKIHEYNETLRNNDYDAVIKELDSNIKLKDSLDKLEHALSILSKLVR